jgi:CRISPR-associated endonuclease/helicase Cas3
MITASVGDSTKIYSCAKEKDQVYRIRHTKQDTAAIARKVMKLARRRVNVLWIKNTVNEAVEVYDYLKTQTGNSPPVPIGLLHSRFTQWERERLETEWLNRLGKENLTKKRGGSILIATQVVEQSVDIDADLLITDIAPSDMILQRIGRIWRHKNRRYRPRPKVPEVWILEPKKSEFNSVKEFKDAIGITSKIYHPWVLWKSFKLWHRLSTVSIPKDIRSILRSTYRDCTKKDPAWLQEIWVQFEQRKLEMQEYAESVVGNHFQAIPDPEDPERLTRHLSVPSTPIILCKKIVMFDDQVKIDFLDESTITFTKGDRTRAAAKALYSNLIKVPDTTPLIKIKDIYPSIEWLDELVYGRALPVLVNSVNNEITDMIGNQIGYKYKPDYGVFRFKGGTV